jgi:ABC-type transport system involved in cytochrome c biogenesis permease subunit
MKNTRLDLNIQEITINEMALTIGFIMLTIGNLGGQWANESWGRYWDGIQTWALISIMVYAFVIHARFVLL